MDIYLKTLKQSPQNEYFACKLVSEYYEKHDLPTSLSREEAEVGDTFCDGYIGYHKKRKSLLFKTDWLKYIDYIGKFKIN